MRAPVNEERESSKMHIAIAIMAVIGIALALVKGVVG